MNTKPTREFVLHLRHIASLNGDWDKDIITLCDAYLLQEDELKRNGSYIQKLDKRLSVIEDENFSLIKERVSLEAENQALRDELADIKEARGY